MKINLIKKIGIGAVLLAESLGANALDFTTFSENNVFCGHDYQNNKSIYVGQFKAPTQFDFTQLTKFCKNKKINGKNFDGLIGYDPTKFPFANTQLYNISKEL